MRWATSRCLGWTGSRCASRPWRRQCAQSACRGRCSPRRRPNIDREGPVTIVLRCSTFCTASSRCSTAWSSLGTCHSTSPFSGSSRPRSTCSPTHVALPHSGWLTLSQHWLGREHVRPRRATVTPACMTHEARAAPAHPMGSSHTFFFLLCASHGDQ